MTPKVIWKPQDDLQLESEASGAELALREAGQEYEIEAICAMLKDAVSGTEYYWTKWTGYPYVENTWEAISDLRLHGDLLAAARFERRVYFEKIRISRAIMDSEPYPLDEISDVRLRRHLGDFYVAEMTRFHEGLTMFLHEAESWRRR